MWVSDSVVMRAGTGKRGGESRCGGRCYSRGAVGSKANEAVLTSRGARHGLQLGEGGPTLAWGNPFTVLTQVPKGARDGATQEAHPQGRRSPPLRRRGRQKPHRQALRARG